MKSKHVILLFSLIVTSLIFAAPTTAQAPFDCSTVTEIPQTECEALVAIYYATNGGSWTNNTGWLITDTPCSWSGVRCWRMPNVTSIGFPNNHLVGSIPPEISDLSEIRYIMMPYNQLSGSIPVEIGKLANLEYIQLQHNQLSGNIPSELGDLTNLMELELGNNQLSGNLPVELASIPNLYILWLENNQLSGEIPIEWGYSPGFYDIKLDNNPLSGPLPPSLMNLYLHTLTFENTEICEPGNEAFQAWTETIYIFHSTNVICSPTPTLDTQTAIVELEIMLNDPSSILDPDAADAIEDALMNLEGANDGLGNNGAVDKLSAGNLNAALTKIIKSIQDIEDAESADPSLDLSMIKETLTLTAKSVVQEVIEEAQAVAGPGDQLEIDLALAQMAEGEVLFAAGDYQGAVEKYQDALGHAQTIF